MFEFFRRRIVPIMIFALVTFVALIVLEWGASMTSSYRYNPNSGMVGEVNGQEITRDQFDRVYQNLYQQQYSGREVQPSEAEIDRLRSQTWNTIVAEVAVQQEIEERGIKISDQDLFYYIRFNPPPIVQNMPQFQTDGKFDYNRYQQIMADPSNSPFWAALEQQMIPQVRTAKMQEIVTTAARVTNQEIRDAYLLDNEKAHFAFVTRPLNSISSDSVTVTESEMREFLAENEYRFQREEMRSIQLALFSKEVSEEDWERVGREIAELADSIKSDTIPFADWALSYSEHESASNGGELGWYTIVGLDTTYVREALALKVGEVSGPVRTAFGWHLIKLLGMQDKDSVETTDPAKAALINTAQILLEVRASDETVNRAERQARGFYQLAKKKGFSEAAEELGVEVKTTSPFQRAGSIQFLGSDFFAGEWAFSSDVGDISGIYDNASNFFVMRLDNILPAGTLTFDDIRASLENLVRNEKLKQMSLDTMKLVYQRIQEGVDMEKAAKEHGATYVRTNAMVSRSQPLPPPIGRDPIATGVAFSLAEVDQISEPVVADRGAVIVKLLEKQSPSLDDFSQARDSVASTLLRQKQNALWQNWYTSVVNNAEAENFLERQIAESRTIGDSTEVF